MSPAFRTNEEVIITDGFPFNRNIKLDMSGDVELPRANKVLHCWGKLKQPLPI
jgi:hypothetical protein